MSKVGVVFKISSQEDISAVMECIKASMNPNSIRLEEIGFGIKVVRAFFVYDDKTGTTTTMIEDQLRRIKGVNEVEVVEESLV